MKLTKQNLLVTASAATAAVTLATSTIPDEETLPPPQIEFQGFAESQPRPTPTYKIPELKPSRPALVSIGRELYFHKDIKCSQCHQPSKSFFAFTRQAIGPHSGNAHGVLRPGARLDVQNVVTPTSLNAALHPDTRQLHDGRAGANQSIDNTATGGALNVAIANDLAAELEHKNLLAQHEKGFFVQACVALQGHNLIDAKLRDQLHAQYLTQFRRAGIRPQTFGLKKLDIEAYALAMAIYQGTITARQAPIQKLLRGEPNVHLNAPMGFALFQKECAHCHHQPGGSGGFEDLQTTDLLGQQFTSPVRVPQLYNLRHKPALGHGGHWKTITDAINGHRGHINPLTDAEKKAISLHLSLDWFDPEVTKM